MTIQFRGKHKSGYIVNVLESFTFPAGEAHIKAPENFDVADYQYFLADIRGHNPQDLFHLAMWANFLDGQGPDTEDYPTKYVFLPYIPGARADRGLPFGADVYATFFNGLFLDGIFVLDPHSTIAPDRFLNSEMEGGAGNNIFEVPFEDIIKKTIQDGTSDSKPQPYVGVIAPDKGARDRAQRAATVMGVPVYTAGKTRDFETGALTGFHMEDELPQEGKFLIVDDICDGGGTFIGLAEAIRKTNPNVELDLWVTHGVFSKGFNDITSAFGHIHTTNSYTQPMSSGHITVHDITPYLYSEMVVRHYGTE